MPDDRYLYLLLAFCLPLFAAADFAVLRPISVIPYSVTVDGVKQGVRQAELEVDNFQPAGVITVGTQNITNTCVPPIYNYDYIETARVPADIQVRARIACLVSDDSVANKSLEFQRAAINAIPGFRSINQFDAASFTIATAALVIGSIALHEVRDLQGKFEKFQTTTINSLTDLHHFDALQVDINAGVQAFQLTQIAINENTTRIERNLQTQVTQNSRDILEQQRLVADLTNATAQLALLEYSDTKQTRQDIRDTRTDLQNDAVLADAEARRRFIQVYTVFGDLQNQLQAMFEDSLERIDDVNANLDQANSNFRNYVKQTQLKAMATKAYYDAEATTPAGYRAFVATGGRPPISYAQDPGLQQIVLMNPSLNFVRRVALPSPHAQLENYRIFAYFATEVARLKYNAPVLSITQLVRAMVTPNCTRPVILNDAGIAIPEVSGMNPTICPAWIEVKELFCEANDPSFSWSTADPAVSRNQQDGVMRTSYCKAGVSTGPSRVFRTFEDFMNWVQSVDVCRATQFGATTLEYFLREPTIGVSGYMNQRLELCNQTARALLAPRDSLQPVNIVQQIIKLMVTSVPLMQSNLQIAIAKTSGSLPNGISTKEYGFTFTPTLYNGDGDVIDNSAAEPERCIALQWNIVSDTTLPVYSMSPKTGNLISKQCIITSIEQTDPTAPVDFPVQSVDQSILYTSDASHLVNPHYTVVGDLDDINIYDVPNNLISLASVPRARENTVTCHLMKPGTVVTQSFEELFKPNGMQYDPLECYLSAQYMKFAKALDSEGYPYCAVPGGVPDNETIPLTDRYIAAPLLPDSDWCLLLKNFQVKKVVVGSKFQLQISPRVWKYRYTIFVPTGEFVLDLGSSNCTLPTMYSGGTTGIVLVLTNGLTTPVQQRVIMTPTLPDTACEYDRIWTVPAQSVPKNIYLPGCSDVTVKVQKRVTGTLDTWTDCVTFNPTAVQDAVAAYSGIAPDVDAAIVTATSETLTAVDAISVNSARIYNHIAQSMAGDDAYGQEIAAKIANLVNGLTPRAPIMWSTNITDPDMSLVLLFANLTARATAIKVQGETVTAANQAELARLTLDAIAANEEKTRQQTVIAAVLKYLSINQTDVLNNFTLPVFQPGPNTDYGLPNVGSGVAGYFSSGWDAMVNAFSGGNIFAGLIAGFITFILPFLILAAVIFGGWWLIKKCAAAAAERRLQASLPPGMRTATPMERQQLMMKGFTASDFGGQEKVMLAVPGPNGMFRLIEMNPADLRARAAAGMEMKQIASSSSRPLPAQSKSAGGMVRMGPINKDNENGREDSL